MLKIAHDNPMSGHFGINKTCEKVMRCVYWPKIRKIILKFCKTCHTCQMVGTSNESMPIAPLRPIPAFSGVVIDCVWPLPKTLTGVG